MPRLVHTAFLTESERSAIRDLLAEVFPEDSDEVNLEHAFGGMHAMVWEDDDLLAHGNVVMRRDVTL